MSYIYVGRLDELKGIRVLFDAWKQMGKAAPHLIICGTGPLEDWCIKEIGDMNINVKGLLDNTEVKKLISESEALILPTLLYEGFPMTIIEAFSVGTPVICSDIGNAGAIVEEDITGWKFIPGDAKSLIDAVKRQKDIRDNVKKIYEERYTVEANYHRLEMIYHKIQTEGTNENRTFSFKHRKFRK